MDLTEYDMQMTIEGGGGGGGGENPLLIFYYDENKFLALDRSKWRLWYKADVTDETDVTSLYRCYPTFLMCGLFVNE